MPGGARSNKRCHRRRLLWSSSQRYGEATMPRRRCARRPWCPCAPRVECLCSRRHAGAGRKSSGTGGAEARLRSGDDCPPSALTRVAARKPGSSETNSTTTSSIRSPAGRSALHLVCAVSHPDPGRCFQHLFGFIGAIVSTPDVMDPSHERGACLPATATCAVIFGAASPGRPAPSSCSRTPPCHTRRVSGSSNGRRRLPGRRGSGRA